MIGSGLPTNCFVAVKVTAPFGSDGIRSLLTWNDLSLLPSSKVGLDCVIDRNRGMPPLKVASSVEGLVDLC